MMKWCYTLLLLISVASSAIVIDYNIFVGRVDLDDNERMVSGLVFKVNGACDTIGTAFVCNTTHVIETECGNSSVVVSVFSRKVIDDFAPYVDCYPTVGFFEKSMLTFADRWIKGTRNDRESNCSVPVGMYIYLPVGNCNDGGGFISPVDVSKNIFLDVSCADGCYCQSLNNCSCYGDAVTGTTEMQLPFCAEGTLYEYYEYVHPCETVYCTGGTSCVLTRDDKAVCVCPDGKQYNVALKSCLSPTLNVGILSHCSNCGANMVCVRGRCVCAALHVLNNNGECVPMPLPSASMCEIYGDPHFKTLSWKSHSYMGEGYHHLVRLHGGSYATAQPSNIQTHHVNVAVSQAGYNLSSTDAIAIKYENITFYASLDEFNTLYVDGVPYYSLTGSYTGPYNSIYMTSFLSGKINMYGVHGSGEFELRFAHGGNLKIYFRNWNQWSQIDCYSWYTGNQLVGTTTDGLCSSRDPLNPNDLVHRDGSTTLYYNNPTAFGESWRVLPGESIFPSSAKRSLSSYSNMGTKRQVDEPTLDELCGELFEIAIAVCIPVINPPCGEGEEGRLFDTSNDLLTCISDYCVSEDSNILTSYLDKNHFACAAIEAEVSAGSTINVETEEPETNQESDHESNESNESNNSSNEDSESDINSTIFLLFPTLLALSALY